MAETKAEFTQAVCNAVREAMGQEVAKVKAALSIVDDAIGCLEDAGKRLASDAETKRQCKEMAERLRRARDQWHKCAGVSASPLNE